MKQCLEGPIVYIVKNGEEKEEVEEEEEETNKKASPVS
jgi:hypothetical protein